MTKGTFARALARVATIALSLLCVIELGAFFVLRQAAIVYPIGVTFPTPSGYQPNKNYVPALESTCYLLRLTADSCPYCRRDKEQYKRLAAEARRAGCQTIEVGPRAGDVKIKSELANIQLEYVDMQMGRSLNPYLTPQTLLLDSHGRMQWQQQGSLDERAVQNALVAIASQHRTSASVY